MVKKIILSITVLLILCTCSFLGTSFFPVAQSQDLSWFLNDREISGFYFMEEGMGRNLLFLVSDDYSSGPSNTRVAVFDTNLNLRGVMENGVDGVSTDGFGFISVEGEFIVGQTQIPKNGVSSQADNLFVPVPNIPDGNSLIYSWEDTSYFADPFYVRITGYGEVKLYTGDWLDYGYSIPMPDGLVYSIPQSDESLSDYVFADITGNLYVYTKEEIFKHALGVTLGSKPPDVTITSENESPTQWATRCSRGYFVSTESGKYILYGTDGAEINRVESDNNMGEVVTIDYDSEYYYRIDNNKNVIVKEKLPF